MKIIPFFLAGVVLSLILSFTVILVIRKSYREIVEELCGTPQRAGYWIRVSELCMVVTTIFAAITFHDYRGLGEYNNVVLFWSLIGQIAYILAAIFLSLVVISIIVLRSLPSQEKRMAFPNKDPAQNQR
jgi:hypothetical protein